MNRQKSPIAIATAIVIPYRLSPGDGPDVANADGPDGSTAGHRPVAPRRTRILICFGSDQKSSCASFSASHSWMLFRDCASPEERHRRNQSAERRYADENHLMILLRDLSAGSARISRMSPPLHARSKSAGMRKPSLKGSVW